MNLITVSVSGVEVEKTEKKSPSSAHVVHEALSLRLGRFSNDGGDNENFISKYILSFL